MCDTITIGKASGGTWIFAKNSDRHQEEPQVLVHLQSRTPGKIQIGTGVEVEDGGWELMLSKPSWIQGGEMGINAHGLAIGNEAVFSRYPAAEDGILGMDILYAALLSCTTAAEARDFITCFVEHHAQGGNGAYKGRLVYSNSFLVCDPTEAYVVETAGARWAWRKAMQVDAISNCYCIEDDYKRLDMQSRKEIAPVNERAACSDEADPGRKGSRTSWRAHVEDRKYLAFTRAEQRRSSALGRGMRLLATTSEGGAAISETPDGLMAVFEMLRSHDAQPRPGRLLGRMGNLCIHPGFFPISATTASMVVEYRSDCAVIWRTDASYPCLSLYKPLLCRDGTFLPLWRKSLDGGEDPYAYWLRRKAWAHAAGRLRLSEQLDFIASRDAAQRSILELAERAVASMSADVEHGDREAAQRVATAYAGEIAAVVREWEVQWGA
ncbi:MAG: hypothetical protein N2067_00480 [Spirochaetaceae bacterium]|nr:hypothetical protein [Spirochaetaceae bacterium]